MRLMSGAKAGFWSWLRRINFQHSARTAVAATASLAVARECRLPEAYWAQTTMMVVTWLSQGGDYPEPNRSLRRLKIFAVSRCLAEPAVVPTYPLCMQ
jgi:hypothetical protein